MVQTTKKLIGAVIITTAVFSANNVWANATADIASGAAVGIAVAAAGTYAHAHLKTSSGPPAETQSLADRRAALDDAISRARASETAGLEPLEGAQTNSAAVAELDAGSAEIGEATDSVAEATTSAGNALRNVTAVGGDGVDVPGEADAGDLSDLVE